MSPMGMTPTLSRSMTITEDEVAVMGAKGGGRSITPKSSRYGAPRGTPGDYSAASMKGGGAAAGGGGAGQQVLRPMLSARSSGYGYSYSAAKVEEPRPLGGGMGAGPATASRAVGGNSRCVRAALRGHVFPGGARQARGMGLRFVCKWWLPF